MTGCKRGWNVSNGFALLLRPSSCSRLPRDRGEPYVRNRTFQCCAFVKILGRLPSFCGTAPTSHVSAVLLTSRSRLSQCFAVRNRLQRHLILKYSSVPESADRQCPADDLCWPASGTAVFYRLHQQEVLHAKTRFFKSGRNGR